MAHDNELIFFKQHEPLLPDGARVAEIGSKRGTNWLPWRDYYPNLIGIDQDAGPNVDLVLDLAVQSCRTQFDLVLCCSVLEHTVKPWIVAMAVAEMVKPNGWLYVTTPWNWRQHDYPIDWWRFSVDALKTLFPGFVWSAWGYSSKDRGVFYEGRSQIVYKAKHDDLLMDVVKVEQSHLLGQRKDT